MVDVTYQMVLSTLQTAGILVGIIYYITIMRNSQRNQQLTLKAQEQAIETRQAQLLMQIYSTLYTEDTWRNYLEAQYRTEFTDYQDFQEKYGRGNPEFYSKILSVWWSYNTIGGLLHQDLLNAERVSELMGTMIIRQWEKWRYR